MATVVALRFNDEQAMLVSDESTWHLGHVFGYRRTNYGDSLASLVDPAETARTGVSAVYGGVGFPSFHGEVVARSRAALAGKAGSDGGRGASRRLATTVHEAFVANHQRMLDDNLRFCWGFRRDELNARRCTLDGVATDIKMEPVVGAARTVSTGSAPGNAYARIASNGGFLLTRDRVDGVQGWYLGPKGHSVAFATPIATMGEGGGSASHLLAQYLERRDLTERRQGFAFREGIYLTLRIATAVRAGTGKMGGYFQIVLVDGDRGAREYVAAETHLAFEIMRAHEWGFLRRGDAEELVCSLLLDGANEVEVEEELFRRSGDPGLLERYLLGFKPNRAPAMADVDPRPEAGTEGGRR